MDNSKTKPLYIVLRNDIEWKPRHPRAKPEYLGYLPDFLDAKSALSAAEQFNRNYAHGGGWCPFEGFKLNPNKSIQYPGDPELPLLYEAKLRDETIRFYPGAWVTITQPDGTWELARMD